MVYIISKVGWEYNDENYYRPQDKGGNPVKAYRSKEKAQAECDRMNGEWLRTDGADIRTDYDRPAAYGYEIVEVKEEDAE